MAGRSRWQGWQLSCSIGISPLHRIRYNSPRPVPNAEATRDLTRKMMQNQQLLRLYRIMFLSRRIDHVEHEITNRGEAFFQLSGRGHESSAVLAEHLTEEDWLHCHYRSRGLLLARGVSPRRFFDNLLCKRTSTSQGRRMGPFFNDPQRKLLSMVTPVGNNTLQAVGVAEAVRERPGAPLVVCGLGDGTTQQGEFLEACGEARRRHVPVLFWIENNRWAISTSTDGQTFFSLPGADSLLGVPIHRIDGRHVETAYDQLSPIICQMRQAREPAIVVFDVERLSSHTSADDHSIYRSAEDLQRAENTGDPLPLCEALLLQRGYSPEELAAVRQAVIREVSLAEQAAFATEDPSLETEAKKRLPVELTHPSREFRGTGEANVSMRQALCDVLRHRLQTDPRVVLFGEDIEDPKGDVFGVTRGLSTEFPDRVLNSPLSESTILGVSIGRSLGRATAGGVCAVRGLSAAGAQSDCGRVGDDLLAHRWPLGSAGHRNGGLWSVSPGTGALPRPNRRSHDDAHSWSRCLHAVDGYGCSRDAECCFRVWPAHADALSEGTAE